MSPMDNMWVVYHRSCVCKPRSTIF